jgi:hypothetical protein
MLSGLADDTAKIQNGDARFERVEGSLLIGFFMCYSDITQPQT